jgi:starvation-inducible outer membrane lipoprotein
MKYALPLLAGATALWLTGCQTRPAPLHEQESTKYSIESTGKFVRIDQAAVICTGLQEHVTDDGRLEVLVNVQNRENHRLALEVRCVFKDGNGFSTGDETPWRFLLLEAGATEAVHYSAGNNLAHKYTIMVRPAR